MVAFDVWQYSPTRYRTPSLQSVSGLGVRTVIRLKNTTELTTDGHRPSHILIALGRVVRFRMTYTSRARLQPPFAPLTHGRPLFCADSRASRTGASGTGGTSQRRASGRDAGTVTTSAPACTGRSETRWAARGSKRASPRSTRSASRVSLYLEPVARACLLVLHLTS